MQWKRSLVIHLFAICLLLIGLLTACQSGKSTETTSNDCFPPLFEFSFPYREPGIIDATHSLPSIPGIIPQVDENDVPVTIHEGDLVVRGDDEIWLVEPFMRYTPSTRETKEYVILDGDGDQVYPEALFLGSDGTLYVVADNSTYTGIVFTRYDEQHDRFEIITPENEIFMHDPTSGGRVHDIVEDQGGNLWFVYKNVLTRFNPITHQAEQMLGEEQGYIPSNTLVMSPGDTLWMAAEILKEMGDDDIISLGLQVIRYDILTGDIQHFGTPPGLERSNWQLFFDHYGRLWFNDYGYLEFPKDGSGTWYQVMRSPIFISDRSGNYRYVWRTPDPKVETHERYLWFTFSGLARLDLETNEWCLVSRTRIYNVAKDSQENLWFISDNQLYKYEFQP